MSEQDYFNEYTVSSFELLIVALVFLFIAIVIAVQHINKHIAKRKIKEQQKKYK